jgi:hypothetical protein
LGDVVDSLATYSGLSVKLRGLVIKSKLTLVDPVDKHHDGDDNKRDPPCGIDAGIAGQDAHDNSAGTVSALVLVHVVAAAELLATVGALEGLIVSVERVVVTLEVLLATEAVRAESADEGLGRVLIQRLLAAMVGSQ